ncbi:HPr kinase/phosphorylase [Amaricoccus tamworthensis]|uniref:HPr kinase/phosphorylase n=1 Tax=Amaricoccus tamworthensis TaxID=57002 RepID=UPI003C7A8BE0
MPMLSVRGTAVAFDGRGLLILGATGSGKSGLAIRLMARGAMLVSDDRVELRQAGAQVAMRAPDAIRGRIEARMLGLLSVDVCDDAALQLVVDLDQESQTRMPQPQYITYLGSSVRLISGANVPNIDDVLTLLMNNAGRMSD